MKPIYPYAFLGALLAVGAATAATTKPVGYETLTLAPHQYNLIGARLFNAQVASGTFESSTATSLVDNEAAFTLTANVTYVVELGNGGTITALGSNFSGTTISGLSGITNAFQTSYVIREATTVASIFGATNQAALAASANADPTEADLILIPKDGGGFTRVFYSTNSDPAFNGWLDADSFAKASAEVIQPGEGFFVQTAISAAPINLVVTGEVKTTPTAFSATADFSLLSSVYPAGATLASSGLGTYVKSSVNADPTEGDIILMQTPSGFSRSFFSTNSDPAFAGWLDADTFSQIPTRELTSGFFIQKIGPNINGVNTPPTAYGSL